MGRQSNAYKRLIALYRLTVVRMRDCRWLLPIGWRYIAWARVERLEGRVFLSVTAAGSETVLAQATNDHQQFPAVTADSSGNVIAVWQSQNQDGNGWGIYSRRFNSSGAPLGNEFLVNQTTQGDQITPAIAADPAGDFVITWISGKDVYARVFNSDATARTNEFVALATQPKGQDVPSVAMDANGNFAVVSDEGPNGNSAIFLQRFTASGAATGSLTVVNTLATKKQLNPSIAMNASGNFVVTWTDQSNGPGQIVAQRFAASGIASGTEFMVGASGSDQQDLAKAALDSAGNFVITWQDNVGGPSNIDVDSRRYAASGTALDSAPVLVNTYTNDTQQSPAIAELPDGRYLIAWQSNNQDGNNQGIYAQAFNADGSHDGSAFLVNTTTQGPQQDPAVAWGGTTAYILWDGQGATVNQTVLGQRYVSPPAASQSNIVPGAQSTAKNTPLVFSQSNGNEISITNSWTGVQLSVTNGTLTLGQTTGLTFAFGTGVNNASMSFSGSNASMNAALQGLSFMPASNFTGSATITLTTTNSGLLRLGLLGGSETDTISVTVLAPINQAPVVWAPVPQSTLEDTALVFSAAGGNPFSIADADSGSNAEQVTLSATNGTLSLSTISGLSFSSGTGTGNASMTFTGTLTNLNAALDGLRFTPGSHFVGTAGITLAIDDLGNTGTGGALTTSGSDAVNVVAVAHTPSVTNAAVVENGQTGSGLVTSPNSLDSAASTWFKITNISGGTLFQHDGTTAISNGDYISGAQGQAGLKFTPSPGSTSSGGFTVQASTSASDDGLAGGTAAATIAVFAPPVNQVPGPQTVAQNTPLVFNTTNGNPISVADPSIGGGSDTVELDVANGGLTLAQTAGLYFTAGNGTSDSSIIFSGTLANINAALNGMNFTPANGYSGPVSIRMITTDNNNSSVGSLSATNNVAVTTAPPNQPPTIHVPAATAISEDVALVFSGTSGNAITVSDLSAGSGAVTLTLDATNGTIALATTSGLTFTSGGDASAAMTFSGTVADINSALSGSMFTPSTHFAGMAAISGSISDAQNSVSASIAITVSRVAHTPAATNAATRENALTTGGLVISANPLDAGLNGYLDITNITGGTLYLNDGVTVITSGQFITFARGGAGLKFLPSSNSLATGSFNIQASTTNDVTGLGGSQVTATISVTAPPTVSLSAGPLAFTQGQGPTAVDPGSTINDPGSATLTGATVQIGNYVRGEDVLTFTNQNGITGSWNAAAGVLTLTGSRSLANYQAALESVRYADVSANPNTLSRTARFQVTDGSATSAPADRQIQVTALNRAPKVSAPLALSVTSGQTLVFSVGNANAIVVSDTDAAGGIEEVTLSATHGTLSLATESGLTFVSGEASDALTLDGAPSTLNAALNGLQFTPALGYAGSATVGVSINDLGNSGAGGPLSASARVLVRVDAPVIVPPSPLIVNHATLDLASNISAQISARSLQVALADGSTSPITYQVITLPAAGTLLLNGTPIQVGTAFTADDVSSGRLNYVVTDLTTAADSFTFVARDDAGAFVGPRIFAITRVLASPPPPPPQLLPTLQYPVLPALPSPQQPSSLPPSADLPSSDNSSAAVANSNSDEAQREKQNVAQPVTVLIQGPANIIVVSPSVAPPARFADDLFAKVPIPSNGPSASAENAQAGTQLTRARATFLIASSAQRSTAITFDKPRPVFPTGLSAIGRGTAYWHELDSVHTRMVSEISTRVWAGSAMCVSVGTSVAYLIWIVRGGSLLSSFLSSVPVWQLVDPLPILDQASSAAVMRGRANEENDGLDALIRNATGI